MYEEVFRKYVGKNITFVEVGVLNGGSLFMWRSYFGPMARIIGIDLNPGAKKWEKDGFEIFIGSQSDPLFWADFYKKIGSVDVLLDDGGHSNSQQIVTFQSAISHINDGGTLLVEDVHTSYSSEFGNPYKYSFVNFAKHVADSVNSRFPSVSIARNGYCQKVFSVGFYESIVVFHIDSARCFLSRPTSNEGITANAVDFKHHGSTQSTLDIFQEKLAFLNRLPFFWRTAKIFSYLHFLIARIENRKLKKYFD